MSSAPTGAVQRTEILETIVLRVCVGFAPSSSSFNPLKIPAIYATIASRSFNCRTILAFVMLVGRTFGISTKAPFLLRRIRSSLLLKHL